MEEETPEFDMRAHGEPGRRRFVCTLCMHVYDEAEGDPDSGLAPGTLWEDIPEDWRCPMCKASKRWFVNELMFGRLPPRQDYGESQGGAAPEGAGPEEV